MKNTNFTIKNFFSKVKAFFVPLKSFVSKNKLLTAGIAVVLVAFIGGYFLKSFFIAATVNGSPISRFKVISELEKRGGTSILTNLIDEKLIKQDAAKKNISVSQQELDSAIASIEANLKSQSQDLKTALAAQGMTLDNLKNQITIQKLLEKLLADKITVTDDEITKYMTDNKITIPAGTDETTERNTIKSQIIQEKLGQQVQPYLDALNKAAKINLFVKY
jgi:hypothetical protein